MAKLALDRACSPAAGPRARQLGFAGLVAPAMLIAALFALAGPAAAQQPTPPPAATPAPADPAKPEIPGGEMREIIARPVLRLKGQSTWDEGFEALKKAIATLEGEAKRLNLPREGNTMTYFVDSDDIGFTYEAMAPLAAPPPAGTAFGPGVDAGLSPAGRAVVFNHEGAYDEIDTAYEALTAWLDDKNLVSTGKFLEEYEVIPEKSDDVTLKLRIVVFLK